MAQARWTAERRTEPLVEDRRVARDGDPGRELAASETRRELGRCLADLPAAQATVVALKDAFDAPFDEISAATGLPVGTAKCYAHRGRNSLRARLTRMMDKAAIEAVLPHRDPMLLIDEVIELVEGERVVARKTVTEEDCAGHFPGNPIMPGVKMVEALAQCGAVAVLSQPENRGKLALFAGIDDVRFKRVVRPGDVLTLECQVETVRGPIGRGKVRATVDGQLAVRGTLTFAVGDEQ